MFKLDNCTASQAIEHIVLSIYEAPFPGS